MYIGIPATAPAPVNQIVAGLVGLDSSAIRVAGHGDQVANAHPAAMTAGATMRRLGFGPRSRWLPTSEVGRLATALDEMAERLEARQGGSV
jgi:hypothetical protein